MGFPNEITVPDAAPLSLSELLSALNAEDHKVIISGLSRLRWTVTKEDFGEIPHSENQPYLLDQYLLSSPNANEILTLLKDMQPGNELLSHLVDTLHLIFTHCRMVKTRKSLEGIAKQIVLSHVSILTRMISDEKNWTTVISAFKLLNSIINLGLGSARLLFNAFDFSSVAWKGISEKRSKLTASDDRSKNIENDVRTHFMRFCMSFLEVGDASLIQSVILTESLVSSFFESITIDTPILLKTFFNCLKRRIIKNESLSTKIRSLLFTPQVLIHISDLFGNQVEKKTTIGFKFLEEILNFFTTLNEPNFTLEQTVPTPDQLTSRNKAIFWLLKQAFNVRSDRPGLALYRKLTIKILTNFPQLGLPLMNTPLYYSNPLKLSLKWLEWTGFEMDIYNAIVLPQIPSENLSSSSSSPPPPPPISVAMNLAGYIGSDTHFLIPNGLRSNVNILKFRALELFMTMLNMAEKVLRLVSGRKGWDEFENTLKSMILKRIPSLRTLFIFRKNCGNGETSAEQLILHHLFVIASKYIKLFPEEALKERFKVEALFQTPKLSNDVPILQFATVELISCDRDTSLTALSSTNKEPILFKTLCDLAASDKRLEIRQKSAITILGLLSKQGIIKSDHKGLLELESWLVYLQNDISNESVLFFEEIVSQMDSHGQIFENSLNPSIRMITFAIDTFISKTSSSSSGIEQYLSSVFFTLIPFIWDQRDSLKHELESRLSNFNLESPISHFLTYLLCLMKVPETVSELPQIDDNAYDKNNINKSNFFVVLAQHFILKNEIDLKESFADSISEQLLPLAIATINFYLWLSLQHKEEMEENNNIISELLDLIEFISSNTNISHSSADYECSICNSFLFHNSLVDIVYSNDSNYSERALSIFKNLNSLNPSCSTFTKGLTQLVEEVGKKIISDDIIDTHSNSVSLLLNFPSLCSTETLSAVCLKASNKNKRGIAIPLLLACITTLYQRNILFDTLDETMFKFIIDLCIRSNNSNLISFLSEIIEKHISTNSMKKSSFDMSICKSWEPFLKLCVNESQEHHIKALIHAIKLSSSLSDIILKLLPDPSSNLNSSLLPVIAEVYENSSISPDFSRSLFSVLPAFTSTKDGKFISSICNHILLSPDIIDLQTKQEITESLLQTSNSVYSLEMLDAIIEKSGCDDTIKQQFVMGCVFGLISSISSSNTTFVEWFATRVQNYKDFLPEKEMQQQEDEASGALFSLAIEVFQKPNSKALLALRDMIQKAFTNCKPIRRAKRLNVLHGLLSSVIEQLPPNSSTWLEIAQVLETIYNLDISICSTNSSTGSENHSNILFSLARAYGATTSASDMEILRVLKILDLNGSPLSSVGYAWGQLAWDISHNLKQQQQAIDSILIVPSPLLLSSVMEQTLQNFPFNRTLNTDSFSSSNEHQQQQQQQQPTAKIVYDPAYILPVLLNVASNLPQNGIRPFAEVGALQYVLCSLSCIDDTLRSISYAILSKISESLENCLLPEKPQLETLLNLIKNTVDTPNKRFPSSISVFFSQAVPILRQPSHSLYGLVNHFLISKPTISFDKLPIFREALISTNSRSIIDERRWAMELLLASISLENQLDLWKNCQVIETIMAEFTNIATDRFSRTSILQIIEKLISCWNWTGRDFGLVQWLCSPIVFNFNPELVASIIDKICDVPIGVSIYSKRELVFASHCLLQDNQTEIIGMKVLCKIQPIPDPLLPDISSLLTEGLKKAIAKDDCSLVRQFVSTIIKCISVKQIQPNELPKLLSSTLLVVDRFTKLEVQSWIEDYKTAHN